MIMMLAVAVIASVDYNSELLLMDS